LERAVEHVQHDEPDRRGFAEAAEKGSEGGTENGREIFAERLRSEHAEPYHRQGDKVDSGHRGRRKHGARHVAIGVLSLAYMAGCRLEGRRREADQIKPRHHRGQLAEESLERRG
jgi:hypothetical protein